MSNVEAVVSAQEANAKLEKQYKAFISTANRAHTRELADAERQVREANRKYKELTEEQKQAAVANMTSMADLAEREAAAELLLDAKGYTDSVVSITDGTVDVVVNLAELTEAQRAQIEDIVRRKTDVAGENIIITPRSPET